MKLIIPAIALIALLDNSSVAAKTIRSDATHVTSDESDPQGQVPSRATLKQKDAPHRVLSDNLKEEGGMNQHQDKDKDTMASAGNTGGFQTSVVGGEGSDIGEFPYYGRC